jgi:hypothetical protein
MTVTEGFGMAKPRNEKAFALIVLSKKVFFFYRIAIYTFYVCIL